MAWRSISLRTTGHYIFWRTFAFNGKKAASVLLGDGSPSYGLQAESISQVAIFVPPSTSAAAKRYWDSRYRHELAEFLGRSAGARER